MKPLKYSVVGKFQFHATAALLLSFSVAACSSDSGGSYLSATGGSDALASGGAAAASGGAGSGGEAGTASRQTFYVESGKLYDRCGVEVVLRGVNEMVVWSGGKDGDPEFSEIAKTGANVVRIVWTADGTAAELDVAIANALSAGLIPMVENHDATGDLSLLPSVVDYWTSPDVVAVLKKYEQDLLLNIANESGDGTVTAQSYQEAYASAIERLRATGLVLPLILDAPDWGQKIDIIQEQWSALTEVDPVHNLLFSVHMWWNDPDGTRVKAELAESSAANMPLIVGEFAQHAVYTCDQAPFAYSVLLDEAQRLGVGWLTWSWGGVPNNDCKDAGAFDMTSAGVFGQWTGDWAEEIAITHPNSIQNTSVRPSSILTGTCPTL